MVINQESLLKKWIPIIGLSVFLSLMIARVLWPADALEQYSDIWDTISGLGNKELNPIGFLFFQLALTLYGLIVFPVVKYIHPNFMKTNEQPPMIRIGTFFLTLGGIGLLLTGLIPDGTIHIPGWDKFHELTSGIGFLGIIFAAFFYFWPALKAGNKIDRKILWIITAMLWIGLILTGISYGLAETIIKEKFEECDLGWYGPEWGECGVPAFYSFAVWERVMFTIGFVYLWLLVKMIPENQNDD